MAPKYRQALITTIKIGLAAGLIYWLVREGALDLDAFARIAQPGFVVAGLGLIFLPIVINNYRWLVLLQGQRLQTTTRATLPLTLIGIFFNYAVPGGVGGDVVKGYYLVQDFPSRKLAAFVSILMDRIIGLFVLVGIGAGAVAMNWSIVNGNDQLRILAMSILSVFGLFIVFFGVAFSNTVQHAGWLNRLFHRMPGGHLIREILASVHSYRSRPGILLTAVILSVLSQTLFILFTYFVGMRMHVLEVPLAAYFFLVPLGTVAMALPIAPAGVGVGQAAFFFLFNLYLGRESQVGPMAVTSLQIMQFGWGLVGAGFYLKRRKPGGPVRSAMREVSS